MSNWINELEALAKAATPAPWEVDAGNNVVTAMELPTRDHGPMRHQVCEGQLNPQGNKDAEFIAALNPATVLRLLAMLRECEELFEDFECHEDTDIEQRSQCRNMLRYVRTDPRQGNK